MYTKCLEKYYVFNDPLTIEVSIYNETNGSLTINIAFYWESSITALFILIVCIWNFKTKSLKIPLTLYKFTKVFLQLVKLLF